ncbi:DsbA family protein [Neobacillus sp. LXY-1]|uniref:DsbA family protein n=1 Tax=Neobacillus sp. LXY-1 TaxID=3379133 RepID=UPI003EDFF833
MANKKKQENKSSKFVFWMIGLIAVGVLALIFLGNLSGKEEKATKKTSIAKIDYSNEPFLGDASAPVSIIEFGDYKCPICKDFNKNTIPLIEKELVDTGKAKLYFMNDSFINVDSTRSAQFAESVYQELGNETFWKFHDLLYEKQPEDTKYEKMDYFTKSFLIDTLREVVSEPEVDKVLKNFNDEKSKAAWQKDMDYVKKLGVTGTPTLFVNGKMFSGKTLEDLQEKVNEAAKGK